MVGEGGGRRDIKKEGAGDKFLPIYALQAENMPPTTVARTEKTMPIIAPKPRGSPAEAAFCAAGCSGKKLKEGVGEGEGKKATP